MTWQENMVFLDANILLELLLPGRAQLDQTIAFMAELTEPTAISVLTAHLVMHFGRKHGISDENLHTALGLHRLFGLEPADYVWAVNNEKGNDFEDALQLAVALRAECERIITLDESFAKSYKNQHISFVVPA